VNAEPTHPFDRSGLAALSDLQTPQWKALFRLMEQEQAGFLEKQEYFRSREYRWPRDSLHSWSRVWEYPYAYHHLRAWHAAREWNAPARVVDVGSGVTFFGFALAKLGYHVTCTDVDPICGIDLARASGCVSHDPGIVDFRLTDGRALPFSDGEADALCCVSVLEHVPDFEALIAEMARILKPGGLLLVTVDLDLRGDEEIGLCRWRELKKAIFARFVCSCWEKTVHPADVLTSWTGPYPYRRMTALKNAWFLIKQRLLKPLLGRRPGRVGPPPFLAIEGMVLTRPCA
jgi:SAM-dependent methyltransferase